MGKKVGRIIRGIRVTEEGNLMVVFQNISEGASDGKCGIMHVSKEGKAVFC